MTGLLRPVALVCALVGLVAGLAGTGAGRVNAQETAEAEALLRNSAEAMAEVSSFHFELSTPRGQTLVLDNFELHGLEGDVQRPDRFRATVSAEAAMLDLSVDVVGVGSRLWVSNPTAQEGGYIELDLAAEAGGSPADLINPDQLLLQAIELIEEPRINGRDEIDGVPVTRIDGRFDPDRVTAAGTPAAGEGAAGEALPIAIWIDDEGRLRRLELAGPLVEGEGAEVVRRLDLSAFDEPVDIQPPTT